MQTSIARTRFCRVGTVKIASDNPHLMTYPRFKEPSHLFLLHDPNHQTKLVLEAFDVLLHGM